MQTDPDQKRNIATDTLRGLACIALVSFHVAGYTPDKGMELPSAHWLVLLNETLVDMRMPLFSFLSGTVFIALEHATRPTGQIMLSKLRRLYLPMLSVGLLYWCMLGVVGQAQDSLLNLPVLPFMHLWFLQATLLIIAAFLLLNAVSPVHSAKVAFALMVGGALWWLMGPRPSVNLFSVIQALYLMPFFMLGYLCSYVRRTGGHIRISGGAAFFILTGLGCLGALLAYDVLAPEQLVRRLLSLGIGAGFCVTLFALAPRSLTLARLGHFSYTIYLCHIFFTAGSREILLQVAPYLPDAMFWLVGLGAGLIGPILVHQVLVQNRVVAFTFLGTRVNPPRVRGVPSVAHSSEPQRA